MTNAIYHDGIATLPLAPEAMIAAWTNPGNAGPTSLAGELAARTIADEPVIIGWPTLFEARMVLSGKGFASMGENTLRALTCDGGREPASAFTDIKHNT